MSVIAFIILLVLIYRAVIVRFRNWIDTEPYMVDHPLPLWVYAGFLGLCAIPSYALASFIP